MDPKIILPASDENRRFHIITPRGFIITLDEPPIPDLSSDDTHAAIQLANLTGCRVTIERTSKTTAEPR